MTSRATRHAAALAAAGLWICTLGFGPAAAQDQAAAVGSATGVTAAPDKPIALHTRKAASHSHKVRHHVAKAKKPAEPDDSAKTDTAKADQPDNAISPNVANANAQWPAETPPANTYNVSDKAGTVLSQMGTQPEQPAAAAPAPDNAAAATDHPDVAASDQLNDLDRAASDDNGKPPLTLARATIDTPEAPAPVEAAASSDSNSPWTQTSMIGKVFIALGGVLTLASAARMFMA